MESIQSNAPLAITGTMTCTSREKLYQELRLESLRKRRWYRKLNQSPDYLFRILLSVSRADNTRTNYKIPQFSAKHNFS